MATDTCVIQNKLIDFFSRSGSFLWMGSYA